MLRKAVLFSMIFTATLVSSYSQNPSYFAAGTEGLDPFTAMFQNGRFVPLATVSTNPQVNYKKQLADVLKQFPLKKSLIALGESGRLHELIISEYNLDANQYIPIFKLQNPPNELTLSVNTPIKLTFLPGKPMDLSEKELNVLQEKARKIWEKERIRPEERERPQPQLTFLTPKILSIDVMPDIVTVVFPVQFSRFESVDDRGTFFFLFDRRLNKTLLAHFGHPEWTASPPDSVISIRPRMFFRIADFNTPYILADFSYGWESSGYIIINMTNGQFEANTTY